jgi:hypothetical protein
LIDSQYFADYFYFQSSLHLTKSGIAFCQTQRAVSEIQLTSYDVIPERDGLLLTYRICANRFEEFRKWKQTAMANFFSFNRNQAVILLTLLLVLVFGALYFFIYIPDNQRDLEEQRFRYLRKIENNIHEKVRNSVGLLNNQLVSYMSDPDADVRKKLIESIAKNPPRNLLLLPFRETTDTTKLPAESDSVVALNFRNQGMTINLDKGRFGVGMQFTMDQFFSGLLPADVFDEYMLLTGDSVIYQTFPIGVTGILKDSLLTAKSVFLGKSVRDITLSGREFKVFYQQFSLNNGTELTVAGLLTAKNYQRERTRLPDSAVLLLLTLAISTVLALPWIKLYQMGSQDRLRLSDALFSFAVSMLLMSLLFFGFFKYNEPLRPDRNQPEIMKRNLANAIDSAFAREVGYAYDRLGQLNKIRQDNQLTYNLQFLDSAKLRRGTDTLLKALPNAVLNELKSPKNNLLVRQAFWLRKDGVEITNWAATPENTPPGNFGNRDYFKMLVNNKPFYLSGDRKKPFYLEQVVSWTTGQFKSVLSRVFENEGALISAISLDLRSVDGVLLPAGYCYSIINDQGKVLYNSKPSKNLSENLIEEFSEYQKIQAAVIANSQAFFKTKYLGKTYHIFIRPSLVSPYHILIMENTSIKNVRDIKIFGFTFLMLTGFFLFLVVQFVTVYLVSRRQNIFTKKYLDISWIGPHKSFHHAYSQIIVWNMINILLLILLHWIGVGFLLFLFILMFAATSVALFLNRLFAEHYLAQGDDRYKSKQNAIFALWFIMFLVNIAAFRLLNGYGFYIIEVVWYRAGILFFRNENRIFSTLRNGAFSFQRFVKSKFSLLFRPKSVRESVDRLEQELKSWPWDYSYSFSMMVFTRLIIISGIPAAFFYISAFNYENNLIGKYRHTEFIKGILDKASQNKANLNVKDLYRDQVWIESINIKPGQKDDGIVSEGEDGEWLFDYLTSYNIAGPEELYRYPPKGLFAFKRLGRSGIVRTIYKHKSDQYLEILSAPVQYRLGDYSSFRNALRFLFYWFSFFLALGVFWYCLQRIIRKLFAVNLPLQTGWAEIDDSVVINSELNDRLFMIGSPGSGTLSRLKGLILAGDVTGKNGQKLVYNETDTEENNVFIADMLLVPHQESEEGGEAWAALLKESLDEKYALVIVSHFEYDVRNLVANNLKLSFLENVIHKDHCKIIIVSTVHMINFLDSLNQQEQPVAGESQTFQLHFTRWSVLLGNFGIVFEKLKTPVWDERVTQANWEKILSYETGSSSFLEELNIPVANRIRSLSAHSGETPNGYDLAYKVEINAHYHYMSIWQSLTKEEKFLLFDLAEDGFVNPFDDYNLTLLISKGLIVPANSGLIIFNKGFRDFILTSIGASEAGKIRSQIRDNGNWKKLKTPLTILIVAVFAFLLASQQEAYSTLLKYISVLTVAVPTALKFFEMFEKNGEKTA